jgi:hypothetical protein
LQPFQKNQMKNKLVLTAAGLILFASILKSEKVLSQSNPPTDNDLLGQINTITTAVPFLIITPDARAGAMGDVGVSSTPDAASIHWNPGKLAFVENDMGFAVSYTPWLRKLVPDINLAYLSGYGRFGKKKLQTIAGSMRYFSLGDITFTDNVGNVIGNFRPNEFALDVAYSRKLSDYVSMGIALRYANSNLTGGISVEGAATKAAQCVAGDVGIYITKPNIKIGDMKSDFAFGLCISNIGNKVSYTNTSEKDFIPINLRFGPSYKINFDEYNSLSLMVDINKLLVPTPPQLKHQIDTATGKPTGPLIPDGNGYYEIEAGKNPNVSVPAGIIQSFGDAPGGFKEEMREFIYSVGMEYWYNKMFSVRAGYFNEHATKGNRKYFTLGAGIRYNVFGLDFAYLIPTAQRHPLENTLRFTLTFDFADVKGKKSEEGGAD